MNILTNNINILKYTMKNAPVYTFMSCFIGATHTIIIYFEHTYMIKYIIDCIQYDMPFSHVFRYILAIFIAVSVWLFVNWLWWSGWRAGLIEKLEMKVQYSIYNKASSVDMFCYDNKEYYDEYVWSSNESTSKVIAVVDTFSNLINSVTGLIVCGGFVFIYDNMGFVFVVISIVGTYICNLAINKIKVEYVNEMKPAERRRDYINRVFFLKDYAKELRLNKLTKKLKDNYTSVHGEIIDSINRYSKQCVGLTFASEFGLNLFIFNGLYAGYLLFKTMVRQEISYGTMIVLYQSAAQLKNAVFDFTRTISNFHENSLYIDKLISFWGFENRIISGTKQLTNPVQTLEFKNVFFSYDNAKNILENVNIKIERKEKIAIVGENGAGKTTLINLVLRLYDATKGDILVNGENIKSYTLDSYRDKFSIVFQDFQIYATTIGQNIAMDNTYFEDKILQALQASGLSDRKMETLPHGIDTMCTKEFDDDGMEFSGGEAQKICIARAIYRNTELIILDEASSALDPISEYNFNNMINEQFKDQTVIFISHRLSTTIMADRIYLLDRGTIAEAGSHDELMKKEGIYAKMYKLQAEKYNFV